MVLTVQEYGAKIGKRSNCLTVKSSKGEKEIWPGAGMAWKW